MKQTSEIVEVAQKYRIKYESPKGRAKCIKEILSGEYSFCMTFSEECHSFRELKGKKARRIVQ